MTLFNLSLRNAKRQARDYLVYFVTIIMAAALIHAFNGLVFSKEISGLSSGLQSMPLIILLASIVVVCIIGWLVYYTTRFMLKKRSRELGTYILLGLENKQVAKLFFIENLTVGGIALILGILLGNLLFQALRAVLMSLFAVPYIFSFAFSLKAVVVTLVYFALIYLFALSKSRKHIEKMKIYELIYLDRQNQGEVIKKSRSRKRIFFFSIVLGIIGTGLLLTRNLPLGLIGAALIIIFLYGFFLSFSSGVPDYFNKRPGKKYNKQNLLIFRGLSSKLATMGVVMATIALLFTATLIAEGTGFIFNTMLQYRNENTTCFDLFIGSAGRSEDHFDNYKEYIDDNISVKSEQLYNIYQGKNDRFTRYVYDNVDYWGDFEYDCIMSQTDYINLRKMLGYSEVRPESGKYIIHCMNYLKSLFESNSENLTVGEQNLSPGSVYTESFNQALWDGNGRGFIIVVPDEVVQSLSISHRIYAAMTDEPVTSAKGFDDIEKIRDKMDEEIDGFDSLYARGAVKEENASMYAMIVFPLYYLALVLTMVAATILSIQLLSESEAYRRQYALLDNLGMDRREMKRALSRQFACFYAMPALPPVLISTTFILALGSALDPGIIQGIFQLWGIVGISLGLFFVIYLTYIFTAYISFKRSVLPE